MNKTLTVVLALLVQGCATKPQSSEAFYLQEKRIAQTCLGPVHALPPNQAITIDPVTKVSPMTRAAACYANQVISVASIMKYQNFVLVDQYARYTLALSQARDRGAISQAQAVANHIQNSALFRQAIADADAQRAAAARSDLADRLAVFAAAMANVSAEQQRQQQANRPVVCSLTGIYRTSGVVCQ